MLGTIRRDGAGRVSAGAVTLVSRGLPSRQPLRSYGASLGTRSTASGSRPSLDVGGVASAGT